MSNRRARAGARGLAYVFCLTALAVFCASPAHAAERNLANARVKFTASASTGLKIVGTGTDLRLETKAGFLVFKVPLSAVTTRVPPRDRQMRDRYLEADTHPLVELKIAREALTVPKADGIFEGDAKANLTLHGKARETIIHYSLERRGESLKVSGSFRIDLRSHGVDIPSYRGITVRPEVDVEVAFGGIDRAVIAEVM